MIIPPNNDEIEVSIFGPGFGECIVIHSGNNEWIIVDSCRFRGSSEPAAIEYFDSLKINPNVKLICASHWHDDHILGMSSLLKRYPDAMLVISAALIDKKFTNIIMKSPASRNLCNNKTGISELHYIYNELLQGGRRKELAQINKDLYENSENGFLIRAISPDSSTTINSTVVLIEEAIKDNPRAVTIPRLKPNEISIVLQASFGNTSILLGADLETKGWSVSLNNAIRLVKSNVYKVAHHGGKSGDHCDIWSKALAVKPISVVAPFRKGDKELPANDDIERILKQSSNVYLTTHAPQTAKKQSEDKYVRRSLEEKKAFYLCNDYGQVCLRKKVNSDDDWTVTLHGKASIAQ